MIFIVICGLVIFGDFLMLGDIFYEKNKREKEKQYNVVRDRMAKNDY